MDYVVKNYEEAKGKPREIKKISSQLLTLCDRYLCGKKIKDNIFLEWDPAVDRFSQRNLYISCVEDYIVHSCYMLTKHYGEQNEKVRIIN